MSIFRMLFLTLVLCGLLLTQFAVGEEPATDKPGAYEEIELFTDVLAIIQRNYVEDVDIRSLVYGGIEGMLATLDPHSSFLTPELYNEMQAETQGEFGGIGIEVTLEDGVLTVVSPIEGTPAQRAGIKARDQIIVIDGKSTQDLSLMEAVRLMRGASGEKIALGIHREGEEKALNFVLEREVIQLQSIKGRTLEAGYGYARIRQFQERTGTDLKDLMRQLRLDNGGRLKGVILDLRNNPGGLLDQAVAVSDLFLRSGLIVYTEGRDNASQLRFQASAEGTEPDYPLILLINEGSASASEIVAGALHDHGRAMLLGERTFGKGSVQTIIPLSDQSGLRLTTARYFTPSGVSIQARGINPDIEVPSIDLPDKAQSYEREKNLANHLEAKRTKMLTGGAQLTPEDHRDFQLMRALDLLKGLDFLQQRTGSNEPT